MGIEAPEPALRAVTTQHALAEKAKLQRHFGRFDMLFFTVCALVGLDTLGQVSTYGAQTFSWIVILALTFLFPYAFVMAELGTAFPQEGGPYEWMKLAFGRLAAGVGATLYWVTNPFWVGGTLCFLATDAWSSHLFQIGHRTGGDYAFKLVFIWISIVVAIVSLRYGKWIPNIGGIVRVGILGLFSLTVVLYALEHGVHGYAAGDFAPTSLAVLLGVVPILLFNFVGFELQSGAAEEMRDPQRDVPITVLAGGAISTLSYAIPIFGIVAVLPTSGIKGISGFLDAVQQTFSVYGGAQNVMLDLMVLGFILALVTSGSVWMMGSDRIQAVAAADGAWFPYFGTFNARFGTPVRVNVLSGVVSTLFMLVAQRFGGGNAFLVVLYLATSTTLLSYLLIFPTAIRLRQVAPRVPRPFVVPFGRAGLWLFTALCLGWMVLGSFVALFPGVLEHLFGLSYSLQDTYGMSRLRFEAFTLGSLAAVLLSGLVGYLAAGNLRRQLLDDPVSVDGGAAAQAAALAGHLPRDRALEARGRDQAGRS